MATVDEDWKHNNLDEDYKHNLGCGLVLQKIKGIEIPLLVEPSDFISVAENVSTKHRLRALNSFAQKLYYLAKSGSLSPEEFKKKIGLVETYGMMLCGPWSEEHEVTDIAAFLGYDENLEEVECFCPVEDDVSDDDISLGPDDTATSNTVCQAQVSRRNFFPGRHFLGTPANVGTVAGRVGDGIPSIVLQALQCCMETEHLEQVLHQVYDGLPEITPINKHCQCPNCDYCPPPESARSEGLEQKGMVYDPFAEEWLCHPCAVSGSLVAKRRAILETILDEGGSFTAKEQREWDRIQKYDSDKRKWAQEHPKSVETSRCHAQEQQLKIISNDKLRDKKNEHAREYGRANTRKKKPTCYTMSTAKKVCYPKDLCESLDEAFAKVSSWTPAEVVTSILLSKVFRFVVDKWAIQAPDSTKVVPPNKDGYPIYYRKEMYRLAEPYFRKEDQPNSKRWFVRNYNKSPEARALYKTKGLQQQWVEYLHLSGDCDYF